MRQRCWNLSSIHPKAFGASTETVKSFTEKNTNLTHYQDFASFPKLTVIQLDDRHAFHLNSSNFDFSEPNQSHPQEVSVFLGNGTIDPKTFTKLNNETAVNLNIGETIDCSTLSCFLRCKPITFLFDERTFRALLQANPKNKVQTNCYLECSHALRWLYKSWNDVGSHFGIWVHEYFGRKFYCVPKGAKVETDENFFGVDVSQFNYGDYFDGAPNNRTE